MGKIRVKTLGDEEFEKEQAQEARSRRDEKKAKKQVKGVGLKGGQRITMVEGVELKGEAAAAVAEMEGSTEGIEKKKTRKIKIRIRSKRYLKAIEQVDRKKYYSVNKAIELIKKISLTRFTGSVDAHVNLNVENLAKDKKSLAGSVNLPHGTGKKRIVAIADEALLDSVANGKIEFDILVAHPSMMPKLAKVARILGPKGLMPNPKNGTVTPNPEKRAKELEGGEINWKTEPDQPIIHQTVGKTNFEDKQLEENVKALISSIGTERITKLTLSATMGPGVKVDIASV